MKLDKLTALWLCWELWDWLAKNPDKEKRDWVGWKTRRGKSEYVESHCFACGFNYEYKDHCGEDCIVPVFRYKGDGCEHEDSPFGAWDHSINKKQNARIIADSAYKEYVKLGGKKRK